MGRTRFPITTVDLNRLFNRGTEAGRDPLGSPESPRLVGDTAHLLLTWDEPIP